MWSLNWPLNFATISVSLIIPAESKTFPIQGRRWRHLNWLTNCRCWRGYRGPTGYEYSSGTNCRPEILNWSYTASLRVGRSGDRIPVRGARFSAPVQTGPGAHPASSTMGTASFLGVKRLGCGVDHPPLSSAEVKERMMLYLQSLCVSVTGYRALCYSHLWCQKFGRVPQKKRMCSEYLKIRTEGKYVGFKGRRMLGNKNKQADKGHSTGGKIT